MLQIRYTSIVRLVLGVCRFLTFSCVTLEYTFSSLLSCYHSHNTKLFSLISRPFFIFVIVYLVIYEWLFPACNRSVSCLFHAHFNIVWELCEWNLLHVPMFNAQTHLNELSVCFTLVILSRAYHFVFNCMQLIRRQTVEVMSTKYWLLPEGMQS